jgi:hypothetical protein
MTATPAEISITTAHVKSSQSSLAVASVPERHSSLWNLLAKQRGVMYEITDALYGGLHAI